MTEAQMTLENSTPAVTPSVTSTPSTEVGAPSGNQTVPQTPATVPQAAVPTTPEVPVAPIPEDWKVKYEAAEAQRRQYQADRDRSEARLKENYKKMIDLGLVDEMGNIGPKQPDPQILLNQLLDRATKGDPQAFAAIQQMQAQQVEQNVMQKMQAERQMERQVQTIEEDIKKTFPSVVKADGTFNANDPVLLEAKQVAQELPNVYDLSNPFQLRALLDVANARLMMRKFPEIEQKLREELQAEAMRTGANMMVPPQSPPTATNQRQDIPNEMMAQWKREGYNTPESLDRVSKIYLQAQKEKGYVLA